ncbi:MAG: LysR substrate-binding domain-containing protein [Methylococcaceae bacterium]
MKLSQIELLRVLQETNFSLSQAAEKLNIVQSAVTRQLQLFESEIGSPLFERKGKRLVAMTPLGLRIMDEVNAIHQAKNNIQSLASDYLDSNHGVLHIATTHTQAKYFLPKPILRFREKYPGVRIYIDEASPEQLIDKLHTGKADIAICTEKVADDTYLMVKPCYEWFHSAIMPKEHPLTQGEITLARLASFPILTYSLGFTGRSNIEMAFKNSTTALDIVLSAADTDVIKTYVRLGLGVGIIAGMAYDSNIDNDLVARDLSHLIPCSRTKIAYLKKNYLPLYGQHFVDELLAAAAEFKF